MRLATLRILGLLFVASATTPGLATQRPKDPNLPWMLSQRYRLDLLARMIQEEERKAAFRELARQKRVARRRQEIQGKVADLLSSAQLLKQSIDDPNIVQVDSFRLVKRCEDLSTELRKLLEKP